jgi:hypothetical protein
VDVEGQCAVQEAAVVEFDSWCMFKSWSRGELESVVAVIPVSASSSGVLDIGIFISQKLGI